MEPITDPPTRYQPPDVSAETSGTTPFSGAAPRDEAAEAEAAAEAEGVVVPVEHDRPEVEELTPERTFRRTVGEGRRRLGRGSLSMAATGVVGGIDVGTGVLALALARGELFTEDLLVPVTAVVARKSRARQLPRLWAVTGTANLAGGWLITAFIISGFPALRATAITDGRYYVDIGLGTRAFSLAILGGTVITLMTWMQHSTESVGAKAISAFAAAFLRGAGGLGGHQDAAIPTTGALSSTEDIDPKKPAEPNEKTPPSRR